MPEATQHFKQRLREAFDSLQVGQIFTYRRTFTEGDVSLFIGVTGDINPYHQDGMFAGESWFERRNIPGLLTASMATHIGGMLGFLATEMTFHYLKPVYVGDTITCVVTVLEKDEEKRRFFCVVSYTNQDDIEVLKGNFRGFPSNVRLAK
ncbi:MAG TPA: MaoC family dehydratase [Blastocatellia bacterium]|nr:MaoC family dehydratase [Blastocatellia bacterium]